MIKHCSHRRVVALFVLAACVGGCHPTYRPFSPYLKAYQSGLSNVRTPPAKDIFNQGLVVGVPAPADRVWNACVKVSAEYNGVLAVTLSDESRCVVVLHGQYASVSLPAFARPQADDVLHKRTVYLRCLDTWLAIAVMPDGADKSRVAVAWIDPDRGTVAPFPGAAVAASQPSAAALFGPQPGATILAGSRLSACQQQVSSSLGDQAKDPQKKSEYVPRLTAEDFIYHLQLQLYGQELWLAKFRATPPSPRGSAPGVVVAEDPHLPELERDHGQWCSAYLRASTHVVACPEMTAALEAIVQRLKVAAGQKDTTLHVYVLACPEINAFTLPNGDVFVNAGLLDAAEDADELAFVLAHECDHFFQHDASRKIRKDANTQAAVMTLMILLSAGGSAGGAAVTASASLATSAASQMTSQIVTLCTQAATQVAFVGGSALQHEVIMGYSRDIELRADANGLRYLWGAGYDVQAAVRMLERLKEVEMASRPAKDNTAKILAFSHLVNCEPGPDERLKQLDQCLHDLREPAKTPKQ